MNKSDYVEECLRQLSDDTFYKRLSNDPTQLFKESVYNTLDHFFQVGEITKKELDLLKIEHLIIPTFYTLPMVHKSLKKTTWLPDYVWNWIADVIHLTVC